MTYELICFIFHLEIWVFLSSIRWLLTKKKMGFVHKSRRFLSFKFKLFKFDGYGAKWKETYKQPRWKTFSLISYLLQSSCHCPVRQMKGKKQLPLGFKQVSQCNWHTWTWQVWSAAVPPKLSWNHWSKWLRSKGLVEDEINAHVIYPSICSKWVLIKQSDWIPHIADIYLSSPTHF